MRETWRFLSQVCATVILTGCLALSCVFALVCALAQAESAKDWLQMRTLGVLAFVFGIGGTSLLLLMTWADTRCPVWVRNLPARPNQLMAWWLKRRGWVAFYLPPDARHCGVPERPGECYLALYEQSEGRRPQPPIVHHATHAERAAQCRALGYKGQAARYDSAAQAERDAETYIKAASMARAQQVIE